MRFNVKTISFAMVLIAGIAALALSQSKGVMAVSASNAQNGQLHATKDCTGYHLLQRAVALAFPLHYKR